MIPALAGFYARRRDPAPGGAPTFVRASQSADPSALSLAISSFQSDGSNRVILVGTTIYFAGDTTSVVWDAAGDNQAFTLVATHAWQGSGVQQVWALVAPSAKTADITISITNEFSDPQQMSATAVLLNGVHQTVPLGTFAEKTSEFGGSASCDVTDTTAGELLLSWLAARAEGTYTQPSGHTVRATADGGTDMPVSAVSTGTSAGNPTTTAWSCTAESHMAAFSVAVRAP